MNNLNLIAKGASMSSTTTTTWKKEIRENDLTKVLIVDKVENGFIITINKYGNIKEGEDRKYIDETKRFISDSNPFEEQEESEKGTTGNKVKEMVLSAISSLGDMDGLISTL